MATTTPTKTQVLCLLCGGAMVKDHCATPRCQNTAPGDVIKVVWPPLATAAQAIGPEVARHAPFTFDPVPTAFTYLRLRGEDNRWSWVREADYKLGQAIASLATPPIDCQTCNRAATPGKEG